MSLILLFSLIEFLAQITRETKTLGGRDQKQDAQNERDPLAPAV